MPPDYRALLNEGDAMAKAGQYVAAVRLYSKAARAFEDTGQLLKALAIYRQVRGIIATHAPGERVTEAEARVRLASLYRSLGLSDEASAVENEPPT